MPAPRAVAVLLVALALLAGSCRVDMDSDSMQLSPPAQSAGDAGADPAGVDPEDPPTETPTADDASEPGPTPTATDREDTADTVADQGPYAGAAPPAFDAPASWHDTLPLDPDVTDGVLPNGLRYLIKYNDRPGTQAQLRLVVHAGSLNEPPGADGTAHFLEHMMFNGTERFPGNEIVQVLESFGATFGPDVNAYTSFEETVYELQLPTLSSDTVQLGLDVLYQWATAATLASEDVVAERGVVREEHRRSVEPLSGRLGAEIRKVLFAGTDYLDNEPIGSVDVIETMDTERLRAFYDEWYRPELMTVVAVGDFDVADMERRIAATFVQPPSDPPVEPIEIDDDPGAAAEPTFDVLTDSEIQGADVEVLWRSPRASSTAQSGVRSDLVSGVTMNMLGTRLFERVQSGATPLLRASASNGDLTESSRVPNVSAHAPAESIGDALVELLTVVEQARQYGFSQAELDRELDSLRLVVDQQYAERATRQDDALAQSLVAYALGRDVLLAPQEQRDIAHEVIDSITVDDARRVLFELLDGEPYVLVTGPAADEPRLPQPEELAAIYDRIVGVVVEPPGDAGQAVTDLTVPPEPAAVTDTERLDALDATVVTYENGARLVYRHTEITENVVAFEAESPGGFFAVEGPAVPLLGRTPSLVAGSGFETVDVVSLDRLLAGSLASVSSFIGRSEEGLSGGGSSADLETILQLIHLQMTEPTISEVRVRQFDEQWRPLALDPDANPAVAAVLELWDLRYGDSPWFRLIPTVEDLDALDAERQLAAYRDRFADAGDFVFAFVGDFDDDELVELGARYLGTLPDTGRRDVPIDRDPGLPEENLVATVAAGIGDQGQVRINWESPYGFSLLDTVTAQALELVVDARLRDKIREELSASYAPNAAVSVLAEPKPWVDTIIEVESDPERVDEVSATVRDELARIRAGDIDPVYLELAVDQMVEDYRFFRNSDWLDLLLFHVQYPDRAATEFLDRTAVAQSLTVADIAAAAAVVFPETRSVEVRLVPAGR